MHLEANDRLDLVWKRAVGEAGLMKRGADFVFYLVADGIVDSHFLHVDRISEKLEGIEEDVLARPHARACRTSLRSSTRS